jgi:hypothetical protein
MKEKRLKQFKGDETLSIRLSSHVGLNLRNVLEIKILTSKIIASG